MNAGEYSPARLMWMSQSASRCNRCSPLCGSILWQFGWFMQVVFASAAGFERRVWAGTVAGRSEFLVFRMFEVDNRPLGHTAGDARDFL